MRLTKSGFTIVELLIVIVVIAILAAISIVAYNGIQDRARSSASASSSTQVAKKVKVWQVDNESISPTCGQFFTIVTSTTTSSSCSFDYNGTNYQYAAGTNGAYCVTTTVADKSYKVSDSTTPQAGGCPGHGQGGVGAVTNLARDPSGVTSISNYASAGSGPAPNTPSIATDRAHHGTSSFKRVFSGSGSSGTAALALIPGATVINGGQQLHWSFWVYSTRAGSISTYMEATKTSDGTYYGQGGGTVPGIPANTWTKVTASATMSESVQNVRAGGYNLQVQSGDSVWFDEFMITVNSAANYADGSTTDWIWNGPANNATSTGPAI